MADRKFSNGEEFEYKGEPVQVKGYSSKLKAYIVDYMGSDHYVSESTLTYLQELKSENVAVT